MAIALKYPDKPGEIDDLKIFALLAWLYSS